jgi:hypothetical protein
MVSSGDDGVYTGSGLQEVILYVHVSSRVVGVEERVEFRVGSKESRAGSKGTEEEARRHGRQLEEEEQYPLTDIRYSSPLSTHV